MVAADLLRRAVAFVSPPAADASGDAGGRKEGAKGGRGAEGGREEGGLDGVSVEAWHCFGCACLVAGFLTDAGAASGGVGVGEVEDALSCFLLAFAGADL